MTNPTIFTLLIPYILLLSLAGDLLFPPTAGTKRRIHISDDLDDVADDEEDDAWKQWGEKSTPSPEEFDPPPSDFSNMDLADIQEMMMKRHFGPVFGFVKLRLGGVRRTPDGVAEIAMKWTKVLRTGRIEVKFTAVDLSTIMFTMEQGRDMMELKEFMLKEPEAYEIKMGDQVFRRPGDPPLEEVIEKLRSQKDKGQDAPNIENDWHVREEL